jgi:glycosyltransferase involved in cell wall biosynthesis
MSVPSPLISVILPAFNSAPYLAQAIESILTQTISDFELLIIYDESSDHTLDIIREYTLKDQRVQCLMGQKARLVGALNQGIAASKGQYIARMDADDISLPTRFEKQLHLMQEKQLDFCGCNMVMMNSAGVRLQEIVMPNTPDLITVTLACTVPFAHGSVIMRKAFLDEHDLLYRKGASAEDYDFWCEAYRLGARFGNADQSLFHYRHFPQSLSKVHAKVVKHHTQALRRNFVSKNERAVQAAISHLLPIQKQLSVRDEGFLILAAYLLWQKTKSHQLFEVLKAARLKNIAIALAKIARGF